MKQLMREPDYLHDRMQLKGKKLSVYTWSRSVCQLCIVLLVGSVAALTFALCLVSHVMFCELYCELFSVQLYM